MPDPVIDATWLADHLDDPDLVVFDVRWSVDAGPGREAYDRGHIPGAVFVDLDAELSAPSSPVAGRHPLPDPARFAQVMSAAGVADDSIVVAYDDAGGVIAARLWWMLDALGRRAAVLDGGIDAWPGPLDTTTTRPPPARFTAQPWPADRLATADQVEAAAGTALIIDARSADRYEHGSPIDPRPGHVPGAHSAPATDNLDHGRFRTPDELAERYRALGADQTPVIAYCGSGVTACADLLALRRAGLPDGRLFVGSWSAWGADPERPAAVGPDPA